MESTEWGMENLEKRKSLNGKEIPKLGNEKNEIDSKKSRNWKKEKLKKGSVKNHYNRKSHRQSRITGQFLLDNKKKTDSITA